MATHGGKDRAGARRRGGRLRGRLALGAALVATIAAGLAAAPSAPAGAVTPPPPLLDRASTTSSDVVPTDGLVGSSQPSISDDGRYVAFVSHHDSIHPDDANGTTDVYLKDRVTDALTLVSRPSGNTDPADGNSRRPQISGNGRYVVFESLASNLVAGDDNVASDVFRWDRTTGQIALVSYQFGGAPVTAYPDLPQKGAREPSISDDGRFIAFESNADIDTMGMSTNIYDENVPGLNKAYLRDMNAADGKLWLVSWRLPTPQEIEEGDPLVKSAIGGRPEVSGDGSRVAFNTPSAIYITDLNGGADVYLWDRGRDAHVIASGWLASVSRPLVDSGSVMDISRDGRFVLFESISTLGLAGDTDETPVTRDLFRFDATRLRASRVGLDDRGRLPGGSISAWSGAMSPDGRYVSFATTAPGLVPEDTDSKMDAFVRDTVSGTVQWVSRGNGLNGFQAAGQDPGLDLGNSEVVFTSGEALDGRSSSLRPSIFVGVGVMGTPPHDWDTHSPVGDLENATLSGTTVTLTGWAADPDSTSSVNVRIDVDGRAVGQVPANRSYPNLARSPYGGSRGFQGSTALTSGQHVVCATALNIGLGSSVTLGCRTFQVGAPAASGVAEIRYLDVGQGDSALYRGACGEVGLIDANPRATAVVLAQLDEWNVTTIKWAIVSHYDEDHVGGLKGIADGGITIQNVYDRGGTKTAKDSAAYRTYYDWVTGPAALRRTTNIGTTMGLCSGASAMSVEVVSVGKNGTAAGGVAVSQENDHSVCVRITYNRWDGASCGDINGVTGSGRADVETAVAPALADVDVVKVNHHGSSFSSNQAFVDSTSPEVAILSLGRNSFGHPNGAVVARWDAVADVYQTADERSGRPVDGTVVVRTNGFGMTVQGTGSDRNLVHPLLDMGVDGGDVDRFLDNISRAFFGRLPTAAERTSWRAQLAYGPDGAGDLVTTLATTGAFATHRAPTTRLYTAYFQRNPDLGGLEYWTEELRSGRYSLNTMSSFFARSNEFQREYGSLDNGEFVDLVYENVLGRSPSATDRQYWIDQMEDNGVSRGRLMLLFSESAENKSRTARNVGSILLYYGLIERMPTAGESANAAAVPLPQTADFLLDSFAWRSRTF